MDRILAYVDENMLVEDFLNSEKNTMIAFGMALQAMLGTSTLVDGLACTPTGPASLQVLVAQGSILNFGNIDGTAYGDIGSDTAHQIVKQGIVIGTTTFTITVPSTTGFSQRYLIQAEFQDQDTGSTVLPYYNSSNPSVAWNGPNNTGTSQNTQRKGACVLSLKAGTAATTGTQVTPTPDAGFIGLWVINVANGATTITSGNITPYSGISAANGTSAAWSTPFITEKLMDKVSIATGDLRWMPLGGSSARTKLTNNTTYNVATTGNDSTGTGSGGAPWLTIQKAINVILDTIDLAGFTATIQVADGTYTGAVAVNQPFSGGGNVILQGNTTTPANCIISTTSADAIAVTNSSLSVQGFKLQTTTTGNGLVAYEGAKVYITGKMDFGTIVGAQISAQNGGSVKPTSDYTISGSATEHVYFTTNGVFNQQTGTITLTGTPAFSTGFAFGSGGAQAVIQGVTFSGSATGPRFVLTGLAVINTLGAGATYLPGNAGGTEDLTSHQYF